MYLPPYRPPCNFTGYPSNVTFLGDLYNNNSTPSQSAPVHLFSGSVPPKIGTGSHIEPYERFANGSPGFCDTYDCDPSTAPCKTWIGTDYDQYTLVASQSNSAPNAYTASGATASFDVCYKHGFKSVAASRNWQGAFGFLSHDGSPFNDTVCATSSYESYQGTADQTKYLTLTTDLTYSETANNFSYTGQIDTFSSTATGNITVNALSGERTHNLWTTETDTHFHDNSGSSITYVQISGGAGFIKSEDTGIIASSGSLGMSTLVDSVTGLNARYGTFPVVPRQDGVDIYTAIGNWNASNAILRPLDPGTNYTDLPTVTDNNNYAGSGSIVAVGSSYGEFIEIGWNRTNTSFTFSFHLYTTTSDPTAFNSDVSFGGSYTLSNPNSSSNVYADVTGTLLAQWPLNDDKLYPWRTSGTPQAAPLVTRNETGVQSPFGLLPVKVNDMTQPLTDANGSASFSSGWTPTYATRAWFDPSCYLWQYPSGSGSSNSAAIGLVKMIDGQILGAPKPAGYENTFCWQFTDWKGCHYDDGSGDVGFTWYKYGYGMHVNDYNSQIGGDLPSTCTQWTDNYFSIGTPIGASLMYNDQTIIGMPGTSYDGRANVSGLVAYKYSEIMERWPSYNFARPAGPDKFLYDETKVYCAADISGSGSGATLTVQDYNGNPFTITDSSGYWGGSCIGGFYNITVTGSTVTLGTASYALPSGWASLSGDDAVCFGKLRFDSAPSILGRVGITYSGSSNTASFVTSQNYFGLHKPSGSEMIDIFDKNMTAIATNITASRIDSNKFTTSASYASASWATIHSQSYFWNDNSTKGDFLYHTWLFDNRTNSENGRLAGTLNCSGSQAATGSQNNGFASYNETATCLPLISCCPSIVCFSPNGETFPNGITVPFPDSFILDDRYGSRWQGVPQKVMNDPLWQKPHLPCAGSDPLGVGGDDGDGNFTGAEITFTEDDGCCHQNVQDIDTGHLTVYFAFPPQVEARNSVPSGYPALPLSMSLQLDSPVTYPAAPNPNYPPAYIGFNSDGTPFSMLTPWILRQRLCNVQTTGNGCDATPCRFNTEYSSDVVGCN